MASVLEIVSAYLKEEANYDGELDPEVDLLAAQIVDSFSIIQLAMFIQERFNIELEPEDLVRANLARLSSIVALVDRRLAAQST
jgi:acyl carrier protein